MSTNAYWLVLIHDFTNNPKIVCSVDTDTWYWYSEAEAPNVMGKDFSDETADGHVQK